MAPRARAGPRRVNNSLAVTANSGVQHPPAHLSVSCAVVRSGTARAALAGRAARPPWTGRTSPASPGRAARSPPRACHARPPRDAAPSPVLVSDRQHHNLELHVHDIGSAPFDVSCLAQCHQADPVPRAGLGIYTRAVHRRSPGLHSASPEGGGWSIGGAQVHRGPGFGKEAGRRRPGNCDVAASSSLPSMLA
jgi:hypothetical protein